MGKETKQVSAELEREGGRWVVQVMFYVNYNELLLSELTIPDTMNNDRNPVFSHLNIRYFIVI